MTGAVPGMAVVHLHGVVKVLHCAIWWQRGHMAAFGRTGSQQLVALRGGKERHSGVLGQLLVARMRLTPPFPPPKRDLLQSGTIHKDMLKLLAPSWQTLWYRGS